MAPTPPASAAPKERAPTPPASAAPTERAPTPPASAAPKERAPHPPKRRNLPATPTKGPLRGFFVAKTFLGRASVHVRTPPGPKTFSRRKRPQWRRRESNSIFLPDEGGRFGVNREDLRAFLRISRSPGMLRILRGSAGFDWVGGEIEEARGKFPGALPLLSRCATPGTHLREAGGHRRRRNPMRPLCAGPYRVGRSTPEGVASATTDSGSRLAAEDWSSTLFLRAPHV